MATEDVVTTLRAALARFGDSASDRDDAILAVLTAELLDLPRFGVELLDGELRRLDAAGEPPVDSVVTRHPAVIDLDARGVPGVVALAHAARLAQERLGVLGAAVVGIRNVGGTGMLGSVVRRLAVQGSIAMVMAESGPFVAPWGGSAAAIGTNPVALAVPLSGRSPFVVDFATAPITVAAVRDHRDRGAPLADGVALDGSGEPTTDADAVAAILPDSRIASLLGLMVQMLAGVATGSTSGTTRDAHALRGITLLAFRPPDANAASGGADLLQRWQKAGGHVPARLDGIPARLADLPARLNLSGSALAALRGPSMNPSPVEE